MAEEETFGEAAQKARSDVVEEKAKLDLEKEILKVRQQKNELYKSDIELAEQEAEIRDKELQYQKIEQSYLKAKKEGREQDVEAEAKKLALLRKQTEEKKKQQELDQAGSDIADNTFKRLTGLFYEEKPETGMAAMLTNPGKFFGRFGDNVKKMMTNPLGIASGVISTVTQQTIALAIAQDQANVQFAKNTGQGAAFNNVIMGLEESLYAAGVTSAEAGAAVEDLFKNVSSFTAMSKSQQEELGKTVAVLQELGVSAENSTKNIQISTKVLGMSTTQAGKLQREMFVFAQGLGVSVDQMSSDFGAMGPQIAALGTNGVAAFKKLQIQAKNTGLQVSELLSMTEKFDKFDSAAESVGKLNALLGGPYLNSLELLTETDPSKRMEIMKKRIDAAGLSFDRMDYYQRKAMASAMGLNEQQLAMFMRGSLDKIMPKPKSGAELEALAKQTTQFNTVAEKMNQIMRSFAIGLGPVVSMLKDFMQFIQPAIPYIAGLSLVVGGVAAILTLPAWGTITGIAATMSYLATVVAGLLSTLMGLYTFWVIGNSPSFIDAIGMVATSVMSLFSPFTMLSNLVGPAASFFSSMATGATNLAESIMGIPDSKAATFTSTVKQTSEAITSMPQQANGTIQGINSAAATSVASNTQVPQAAPAAQTTFSGPAPTINLSLSIAGEEIAAVVNSVEVSKTATNNTLYDSIIGMIEQGLIKG